MLVLDSFATFIAQLSIPTWHHTQNFHVLSPLLGSCPEHGVKAVGEDWSSWHDVEQICSRWSLKVSVVTEHCTPVIAAISNFTSNVMKAATNSWHEHQQHPAIAILTPSSILLMTFDQKFMPTIFSRRSPRGSRSSQSRHAASGWTASRSPAC